MGNKMKILFLHLSDAHLSESTDFSQINKKAMINALTKIGNFDECILVFSGDIVNKGSKNEFLTAGKFIGSLAKNISEKFLNNKTVKTLIVPGNHDNVVKEFNRTNLEIEEYYRKKTIEEKFNEELGQLENFYEFAHRNYCFKTQKIIDIRILEYDNFSIRANLINSAPFSLLGSGNEDKGLHFIPQNELDRLSLTSSENYTISIIHHGPEWFSDNVKHIMYNKLYENSDLIFVGHEHFSLSENKKVNGNHIDISSGVALYGTKTEHGFNTIVLDTENHTLKGIKHIYNGKIYKPIPNLDNTNVTFHNKYNFAFTPEFQKQITDDENNREGEKYAKYFVFPSLESKEINVDLKNYTVTNEEKFLELFSIKDKISIEGAARSGKTILSKYLCSYLSKEYITLYLNEESFVTKDEKRVLKYAFVNQYGEKNDYDEFQQMDKSKKVLIVDGYDRIKKEIWTHFLALCNNEFGHIIMFCGIDWNMNIKERAVEELTENPIFHLRICPFYYIKREQLINKICNNYKEEYQIDNVQERSKKINEDITNQIKFFQLTPEFIHQFVEYYISFSHIKTQKETNVFSKVFEANITFRISKNTRTENDVDEIMVALDFVAHYIHFNKKYPLSYIEFEEAVNEYKERYDNQELKNKYVYDVAIKSNILKEVSGKFEVEFCDENILAYFVAQHLNRSCNNGERPEDLKYVLDNICFGINGDIILFLSYITSNVQILSPIMNSIFNHMDSWEELDLDNENIEYLSKITTQVPDKIPDNKDKEKNKQNKELMERKLVEEKKVNSESLYSYDEKKINSFGNKISKSINYLELVAKILPNFRHILEREQKQAIVNTLYTYPNKLLYFMLKDIDKNYDDIICDILKSKPKTRKGLLITKDMLDRELQNQSIAYILSIYDFIATTATTIKTISDLEKFDYKKNTNYRLQNLMMKENIDETKSFFEGAEQIFNDSKLNITKQMTKLIVRKYFMNHEVEMHGDAVRVIDKFFGDSERKNIQIVQVKNKIIKK